ncbi:MAG: hypothetical protein WBN86_06700, partial [Porticoccaceae bacterium]
QLLRAGSRAPRIVQREPRNRDCPDLPVQAALLARRLIPVSAIAEQPPTLVFVTQIARPLMNTMHDDVGGKLMVTAFCLLVFGVFLAIVVANLA